MALFPPDYLNAVVAIGTEKNEWFGTGFFYAYEFDEDKVLTFLVTNKHIIESQIEDEKTKIHLKFTSKVDGSLKIIDIDLFDKDDELRFYFHTKKDVDIAVCYVDYDRIKEELEAEFFGNDLSCDIKKMKKHGIGEGDPVFVFGFPMGNIEIDKKSVIVRNGSIARIKDVYYGHSNSFLIDSFIFPGNSGGPVFLKPEDNYYGDKPTINSAVLLGVVKEYLPYEDIASSEQTGLMRVIFTENSGLALVHPMDYVHQVINIFRKRYSI